MALRSFLHISDNACKCVFTAITFKPKSYVLEGYKQVRFFNKFRGKIKLSKSQLPNEFFQSQSAHFSNLWKPFTFTIIFSATTFVAAVIWEYECIRDKTYRIIGSYQQWRIQRTGWRHTMENWWKNLSEGEKVFVPICFLNVLVFLSWHVPAFRLTMYRYFSCTPASNRCWPMVLGTFSHCSLVHLIINMYVLYGFSKVAVAQLGREQFLTLYLTSGVISSFSSYLYKAAVGIKDPSLGASGAIMGVFGFVCTQFPNAHLSIVFLPMLKFTASVVMKAVMGLDTLGCLMRWQRFDHAAHLGGVLFGIFWQMWGSANIWQKREPVLVFWHQIREPSRSK